MEMDLAPEMITLFAAVRQTLGLRLEDYRSRQLERRLHFFRERHGLRTNAEVAMRLYSDPGFRRQFADFITINVSTFFRNPERYEELHVRVLPDRLRARGSLRIWSAGCSVGAEPFSVAMLLHSLAPTTPHTVLGTDIDAASLDRCRAGVYQDAELQEVPPAFRSRYFAATAAGWQVYPAVRSMVQFRRLDLLQDPFPTEQDLIICRNVVIYFTEVAKGLLLRRFGASLRPGGWLFIGATESIFDPPALGLEYRSPGFYQRAEGGGGSG